MKDFSFQGKIYLGERRAGGRPGKLTWVGDAPNCTVTLNTESEDRTESYSGQRLQSARLRKSSTAELALTLNYFNADTLALGLYATVSEVAAGTATEEILPANLLPGSIVALDNPNISDLVLVDSTGAPVTLVEGTHYAIESAQAGTLRMLSVTGLTQPIIADSYDYAAGKSAAMFTADPPERYFLMDGINTITGERVRAHLYRVQFNPASSIPLINSSFGQLELSGAALFDVDAANDPELGGFGKFDLPAEAE